MSVIAFIDNGARTLTLNTAQALVVSQLATNDSSGSKYFVQLRAADNGLLGPIAILIVLVRVLGLVVRQAVHWGPVPVRSSRP